MGSILKIYAKGGYGIYVGSKIRAQRRMPRLLEAKKDVASCDKLRGLA